MLNRRHGVELTAIENAATVRVEEFGADAVAAQRELAEDLVRERASNSQDWRLPQWLKERAKARGDLAEALAISKKAVRVGFEWPNIEGVLDKLIEEAHEIAEAATEEELESEIGDLLFSAVNLARWRNVDAESALRATNARFIRRFKTLEALAAARNKSVSDMSIEEMDVLWDKAKSLE